MENKYELYKTLLDMNGIAGHERQIKKFVKQELQKYTDNILEDGMGGVFGVLEGNGPTIMFCGHMDEVGYMVSGITPKGMIKLLPIGGMNPEVYLSQNMHIVINKEKTIKGIIGAMPPHLTKGEKRPITHDELLLDIGADSKEEAIAMGVKIGQQIVSENDFYFTEDGKKIVSKAWDDRFGVGMVLELIEEASKKKHNNRLVFGATVQEEVGLRGGRVAAQMVEPDLFIAIDVSPADDFVSPTPNASLGKGFLIRYFDPSIIMNRGLHDYFEETAIKNNIKYQEYRSAGGTDAAIAQYAGKGILSTTIGLPGRYIHTTAAMVHVDDIEAVKQMALAIIDSFDNETFQKIKDGYED